MKGSRERVQNNSRHTCSKPLPRLQQPVLTFQHSRMPVSCVGFPFDAPPDCTFPIGGASTFYVGRVPRFLPAPYVPGYVLCGGHVLT